MTVDRVAAMRQLKQQARSALQANDPRTAGDLLRQICENNPGDVEAWLLLSAVHGQAGNFDGVIECCNRVLTLAPGSLQACAYLGGAYASLGQHEKAAGIYRKALTISPGAACIRSQFGHALLLAGKVEEAVSQFQEAIDEQPGNALAVCGLGKAFETMGQYDKAKAQYQRAVGCNPGLLEASFNLGMLLSATGMLEDSEACFQRAIQYHPEAVELYYGLARARRYLGRFDDALHAYEQVLHIRPDDPVAIAGEADIHERKGEFEAAYMRIRSLQERGSINADGAGVFLRLCRRYDCCDEAIELAKSFLDDASLKGGVRRMLCNRLGKLYDRLGRFDDAFAWFEQANDLTDVKYNAAEHRKTVDSLVTAFSREAMDRMPRARNRSQRPVFIVGMPRSGTSLVEQILSSHPEVFGAGELLDIAALVHSLPATIYLRNVGNVSQDTLDGLAQRYFERLDRCSCDAQRVTDKMPGNYMYLGMIALMFPGARVVHCVRDPLDTCLSIFFQNFNLGHAYATDLSSIGAHYNEYRRLMAHWKSVLDIPILDVSYEELVEGQEATSRKITEFAGLPWDDRCLQFHTSERAVATASYAQVRKAIYTSSLARWKNYEKHLGPLRKALGV